MKRLHMTRLIAGIFAASVMMFSFTGCENQQGVTEPGDKTETSLQADKETEKENLKVTEAGAGHSYENVRSIHTGGDRIYIFEQMNGVLEHEVSVTVSATEKKPEDFSLEASGYSYIQYATMDDARVCLIYADEENAQHICTLDRKTGEVSADMTVASGEYVSSVRSDSSGNFTVLKSVYGDGETKMHLAWYAGETLEEVRDENLTDTLKVPEDAVIIDAFSSADGSAYVYADNYLADYTIEPYFYRIDAEGAVTYTKTDFENWSGNFTGMYLTEKGNICLCTTPDYAEYSICEVSPETGDAVKVHKIDIPRFANFAAELSLPGYDFTYISSSGVTGCSFETGKTEVVLEFGTHLDPSLRNSYIAASSGDTVYMYSIANAESNRLVTVTDAEGGLISSSELPAEKGYVSEFCTDTDGNMYYSETYDPGMVSDDAVGFNMAYVFHVLDSEGNHKSSFKIDEINETGDSVIQNMCIGGDGRIYMLFQTFEDSGFSTTVYAAEKNGKIVSKINSMDMGLAVTGINANADGSVTAVCLDADNRTVSATVNAGKNTLDEKFTVSVDDDAMIIPGTGSYDLYWLKDSVVYGFRENDEKETAVADLSGIISSASYVYVENDSRILCGVYDTETGETSVKIVTEE